jgi:outer membrane protein assembly factor BamB
MNGKETGALSIMKNHSKNKILRVASSLVGACSVMGIVAGGLPADGAVNVTQHHNHLSRDGLYIDPAFTTANAAGLTRDLAFNGAVEGDIYAQPLYIEGGPRGRAVVIAVTESNNVYALDAETGDIVWEMNVAPPVAASSLPCGDLSPFGITGTPVVDLPSRALFFNGITENFSSSTVEHLVFSLNVDTGAVNPGWPVNVNNNAVFGGTKFSSLAQGERGALTVIGSMLYVPYGGLYGDCGTYYGWVVGMPLTNPSNGIVAWATSARGGGAWSVGGIASDGTDPFVATGNTFGASTWGGGEAIVHLQPNLTLAGTVDYWAPTNWSTLDSEDLDIGGSGPLLITVPGATPSNLVVALGKDGNAYLLNRTNLGGVSLPLTQEKVAGSAIIQAAASYQTALGTYVVLANANNLYSLRISATSPPTITRVWTAAENGRGSPFVTSTDGTNNVVVWGIGSEGDQRLHGFDGDTGTNVFTGGGANELMTGTRRFNTGIVARGRIYLANDNQVYAFNAPGQTVAPITMTNLVIVPGGGFQFSFTNIPGALFNVFASTNLAAPFTNWTWLGGVPEVSSGNYLFTDTQGPGNTEQFYQVSSP